MLQIRVIKIRITRCERGGPLLWGLPLKQIVCAGICVCVCVCRKRQECCVRVMRAGGLVYTLSYDKCSLSYNLCASKYDVYEDEL